MEQMLYFLNLKYKKIYSKRRKKYRYRIYLFYLFQIKVPQKFSHR